MSFTDAHSPSAVCSPTRYGLLTGRYAWRTRLQEWVIAAYEPPLITTDRPTLPRFLKKHGYYTICIGKWHLGWEWSGPQPSRMTEVPNGQARLQWDFTKPIRAGPTERGFDYYFGVDLPNLPPFTFIENDRVVTQPTERYEVDPGEGVVLPRGFAGAPIAPGWRFQDILPEITRRAVRKIHERAKLDAPFFLYFSMTSPHEPIVPSKDFQGGSGIAPIADFVMQTDWSAGQVIKAVDDADIADDTIVIFTADNGGNMYDRVDDTTPTSNLPLRGGKATIYEGGSRVPLVVIWPGHVEPGSTSDAVVSSIDYYPTILEMLGLDAKPGVAFDGVSIVPALKGGTLAREAVFCHFPHPGVEPARFPATSVRKGDWKLIHVWCDGPDQTDRYELYNLADDLGETNNLADAMPDKVKELDALIRRHLDETQALVPKPNPAYDPTRGPVAGWHPSSFCKLSARDGRLVVESTGGDPNLSTGNVPAVSGELVMKLRVRSTSRGAAHFYWATQKGPRFRREVRLDLPIEHDGQWHEHAIEFTADSTLRAVRIDPSSAPGRIEFDRISLCRPDGTLLKEWEFDAEAR